jgi:hypothetical protein
MTQKRSRPRPRHASSARPIAARRRYDATPWPGLVGAPFVLLLNLLVITAEDNARTDGPLPMDAVHMVQALVRQRYDFPDLALEKGRGVAISMIGHFIHVDDYRELRIARMQRDHVLEMLRGEKEPLLDLGDRELRRSTLSDPQSLAGREEERALAFWYKQRLLAFYFVGERAQIERLTREPPGEELLQRIMAVLARALDLSEQVHAALHPAFVRAADMPRVSLRNAMEWAEVVKDGLETGKIGAISVVGPPGPTYTVRRRTTDGEERA